MLTGTAISLPVALTPNSPVWEGELETPFAASAGEEILGRYQSELVTCQKSPATVRCYMADARELLAWLTRHGSTVKDLSQSDMDDYVRQYLCARRTALGQEVLPAKSTVLRKGQSLRLFMAFLRREKGIDPEVQVVLDRSAIDDLPEACPTPTLSPEIALRVLAHPDRTKPLGIRDHAILALLLHAGLRVSELHRLNIEDVEPYVGRVTIEGKNGTRRDVMLGKHGTPVLQDWMRIRVAFASSTSALVVSMHSTAARRPPGTRLSERGIRQVVDRLLRSADAKGPRVSCLSLRKSPGP